MKLFDEMSYDLDFRKTKAIVSDRMVILENVSAIVMISPTSVTVSCGKKYTTVTGRSFNIKEIYEGRLLIEGEIQGVEFLQP